jgi:hypothetical protein
MMEVTRLQSGWTSILIEPDSIVKCLPFQIVQLSQRSHGNERCKPFAPKKFLAMKARRMFCIEQVCDGEIVHCDATASEAGVLILKGGPR